MAEAGLTGIIGPIAGGYLALSSAAMLSKAQAKAFFDDLRDHAGAVHAVGTIAFFVGAAILAIHWRWASAPEAVLSGVAIFWTFEGAGLLLSAQRLQVLMGTQRFRDIRRLADAVMLAIGIYLIAFSPR